MTTPPRPLIARCPECDSRLYFDRPPDLGQILPCPECETSLEVIGTNPVRLDWAYDEGDRITGARSDPEAPFDEFGQDDTDFFADEDDDWS
jgi:lysine biosynthesis protein LysW